MKKIVASALAIGSVLALAGTARAGASDDVMARLAVLEKENAAIRKENAALRENKTLRVQNATLKSVTPVQASTESGAKRDPFGAYAADMPMAYKARSLDAKGQLRVWGEGGAMWSGGDPVNVFYAPVETFIFGGSGVSAASLTPNVGWEAATGFDYRFVDSPWHVSGQFRYGEGRKNFALNQSLSIAPGTLGLGATASAFLSETGNASSRETHWLTDIAIGRDVLGGGADAMQLKFGIRAADFEYSLSQSTLVSQLTTYNPPRNNGTANTFGTLGGSQQQKSSFLGVGPRIGIEGAVPLASGWSLDYLGDAAVLFGNRKFTQGADFAQTSSTNGVLTNRQSAVVTSIPESTFATVFNADVQVGVSYWLSQNVKVSASYRLDAYFGAISAIDSQQDTTKLHAVDRYIHGPHLGFSATF